MHADRVNRAALALLGLLLLALGVSGILLGAGVFGEDAAHRNLLDNSISHFIGAHGGWVWPAVAVVAVVIALLSLRWLLTVLFSTGRLADITVAGDHSAGRTTLTSTALGDALSGEIESYRGVHSARTHLEGDPTNPQLAVTVNTQQNADLAALRRHIETNALAHARHALGVPDLPIRLDITVTRQRSARVT
ncbi:alkaline shock response membrane anchor protein AmaP [Dactylosporangium sp. NPDC000555]|uniref:alkaline shock response membrane anchor protein AmaP n=1 Tax=Dactylosporangium sp. NPDC000555 TaxID=3154260 RepID=UPI0033200D28